MNHNTTSSLMLVGTSSNVGKSVLCTALCRIFFRRGFRVAPFKAQNMSLNSAVTPNGKEIGRAQAVQAEAAGIPPTEHMNPVLLKPSGRMQSQVVVQGTVYDTVSARHYFEDEKTLLWQAICSSYQSLAHEFDLIVMEGAGSPVEMNLKSRDVANMRAADMANARVILVADIDRGGIFASVLGTMALLTEEERDLVIGVIVNKFRGDAALFEEGRRMLAEYAGVPVLGVIPYISHLNIDEEDSVGLEKRVHSTVLNDVNHINVNNIHANHIHVAIVRLPHISNFTDFDALFSEEDVFVQYTEDARVVTNADIVILPGTKNTMDDLQWLFDRGIAEAIVTAVNAKSFILGICGGYQMMGTSVRDEWHVESTDTLREGLGLLDYDTELTPTKRTVLVEGKLNSPFEGISVRGYEVHMGRSTTSANFTMQPLMEIFEVNETKAQFDGVTTADAKIMGTYMHGILDNDAFRIAWLNRVRQEKGLPLQRLGQARELDRHLAFERLADEVEANLDVSAILQQLMS